MNQCDFCSSPHPTWAYPARTFEMRNVGWGSISDWAACEECADLIEHKKDDAMINQRMPRTWAAAFAQAGMPGLNKAQLRVIEEKTRQLYMRFKKARAGPRKLIEAA